MAKSFLNTADSCSSVGLVTLSLADTGEYNKHLERNTNIIAFMQLCLLSDASTSSINDKLSCHARRRLDAAYVMLAKQAVVFVWHLSTYACVCVCLSAAKSN